MAWGKPARRATHPHTLLISLKHTRAHLRLRLLFGPEGFRFGLGKTSSACHTPTHTPYLSQTHTFALASVSKRGEKVKRILVLDRPVFPDSPGNGTCTTHNVHVLSDTLDTCRWKFLLDSASVSTLLCTRNGGCHYFLNMFFNILVAGRPCFILLLYIRCCVRATEGESLLSDHVRQGKLGRWDGQSSAPVRTYQCLCVRFSVCAQRPV